MVWTSALLSLVFWIGGAVYFAAFVARTSFAVLPTRTLAGELNGRLIAPLEIGIAGSAAIFFLAIRLLRRKREIPLIRRLLLTRLPMVALTAAVVSRAIVTPRLHEIRASMPFGIENVPSTDPLRIQFGRFHAMSSSLLLLEIFCGLVCLSALAAEISHQTSASKDDEAPSLIRLSGSEPGDSDSRDS